MMNLAVMCVGPVRSILRRVPFTLLSGLVLLALATFSRAALEDEIRAFEAADAANPPPSNVIPFVGSSSFNMWSGLAAAFPNHPVLNRGFGGSQMSDVLSYFDRIVTKYHPPLVVVYEGDNDLAAGKSVAQVFADYSNFVWRVQQQLPGTDIAFLSVKPSPSRASLLTQMAQLNALIQGMADGRHIRYIDIYTPMLDGSGQPRPELFGSDMLHMNAAGYTLWTAIIGPVLDAWTTTAGGTYLFDFGAAANTTTFGPAPADPAHYWNNVNESIGGSDLGQLTNVVTTENSATSIRLSMLRRFNGANGNGTSGSSVFPAAATADSLFGNTELFGGQSNVFPAFKLTGLDTQLVYEITFFASRTNVGDNRETRYTIAGGATQQVVLNAANNVSNVVTASNVTVSPSGEITVDLAPTENNNSANHFTYVGVMRVDAIPPQRPISFLEEPANAKVAVGSPATFRAAVAGSPPFYVQWLSNDVPITGAVQLAYTIPVVSPAMNGSRFSVSVSNLAFAVRSSNAVLEVVSAPAGPSSEVLLFDFGGANTTEHAAAPDDPLNFWNNITAALGGAVGSVTNLVSTENASTRVGLAILSRFNANNDNGTTSGGPFPADATRDSLFGNTETFNGVASIFPRFKLTGLLPGRTYALTFYASRLGVSDNRETGYTVTGAKTNFASLNVANNITNLVTVAGVRPAAAGEIIVALAPTANNNNANHFTYLGVMKLELGPVLQHLPPRLANGQLQLNWTGSGQLEWAPAVTGPWNAVAGDTNGSYSEQVLSNENRFFRLRGD